jgi:hypothetical protein
MFFNEPNREDAPLFYMITELDPVSKMLCFRTSGDKV